METPICKCLACGYLVDSVSNLTTDERKPQPGDISICLMCGHLMGFNLDLTVRELTDAEMYAAAGDKRILEIQKARIAIMDKKSQQQ
jgi:hypothetical protein